MTTVIALGKQNINLHFAGCILSKGEGKKPLAMMAHTSAVPNHTKPPLIWTTTTDGLLFTAFHFATTLVIPISEKS